MYTGPKIKLTSEQLTVVNAPKGHYVVTAVAGSGKTTTLAHRIVSLLGRGQDHRRVLVLMFNKAAQLEFSEKLRAILPTGHQAPEVRTFHSMGYRIYQRLIRDGHLPAFDPRILAEWEIQNQVWKLARAIAPESVHAELKRNKKEHLEIALRYIEAVKSQLDSPQIVFERLYLDARFNYLPELFSRFEQWRQENRRISYSDMLYDPVRTINTRPELEALISNKMDTVLVDEYQDTNDIQHVLLKIVAGQRAAVTVVGDPDQTIYEFRGAKPQYMLEGFQQDFPDCQKLELSVSFRYGHEVALMANHLIRHNQGRTQILCHSHASTPDTQTCLYPAKAQAKAIDIIKQMTAEQRDNSAILVRVWSQTISTELKLLEANIPYQMAQHKGVFSSDELNACQSLLELASSRFGILDVAARQQALYLLLRFPHLGLSDQQNQQLAQTLAPLSSNWGKALQSLVPRDLLKFQKSKLERLAQALTVLETGTLSVEETFQYYLEHCELFSSIRSMSLSRDAAEEKIATISAIRTHLEGSGSSPDEVLHYLDTLRAEYLKRTPQGILISTIHRAKGLEWDTVILPGFNGRHYPYSITGESLTHAELESERRLLYVALTRACKQLHILPSVTQEEISPSPFTHELCWELSTAMAEKLRQSRAGQSIELKQGTDICKRYAATMGLSCTAKESVLPAPPHARKSDQPVWFAERIHHSLLGFGRVVDESAQSFTVEFDAPAQRKEFSKKLADKFFSACH